MKKRYTHTLLAAAIAGLMVGCATPIKSAPPSAATPQPSAENPIDKMSDADKEVFKESFITMLSGSIKTNKATQLVEKGDAESLRQAAALYGEAIESYEALLNKYRDEVKPETAQMIITPIVQARLLQASCLYSQRMLEGDNDTRLLISAIDLLRRNSTEAKSLSDQYSFMASNFVMAFYLLELYELTSEPELLEETITAVQASLPYIDRKKDSDVWGKSQYLLGSALNKLYPHRRNSELPKTAISAYREALTVFTRESDFDNWFNAYSGLGSALLFFSTHNKANTEDRADAKEALAIFTELLALSKEKGLPASEDLSLQIEAAKVLIRDH